MKIKKTISYYDLVIRGICKGGFERWYQKYGTNDIPISEIEIDEDIMNFLRSNFIEEFCNREVT